MSTRADVKAFFDEATNTVSYLVADPMTGRAAIIDPVLDYDHRSGKASASSSDVILQGAAKRGLHIDWILETHAHADHLSAAPYLRAKTGATVGIGEHIRDVQTLFRPARIADRDDRARGGARSCVRHLSRRSSDGLVRVATLFSSSGSRRPSLAHALDVSHPPASRRRELRGLPKVSASRAS